MPDDNKSQPKTSEPIWGEFAHEYWNALMRYFKVQNPPKLPKCYDEKDEQVEEKKK